MNDNTKESTLNVEQMLENVQEAAMEAEGMARLLMMAASTSLKDHTIDEIDVERATQYIRNQTELARSQAEYANMRASLTFDGIKRMAFIQEGIAVPENIGYVVGLQIIYPNGSWKESVHEERLESEYLVVFNTLTGELRVEKNETYKVAS